MSAQTSTLDTGTARLVVTTRGDASRASIVLIHGYPDSQQVWSPIAQALAEHYHVITYDVRGAGQSSRPRRIADYTMPHLMHDLTQVIARYASSGPVHLVGHDWGSIQGWEAVTTAPLRDRVSSFTSISGPCLDHVALWSREQLRDASTAPVALDQMRRSWYMLAFHVPGAPELVWAMGAARVWPQRIAELEGEPDARLFDSETRAQDGRDGIKLYRANIAPRLLRPRERPTTLPVQVIVPTRDPFVSPALWRSAAPWCARLTHHEVDAGHWVIASQPERVARWIEAFVAEHGDQAAPAPPIR